MHRVALLACDAVAAQACLRVPRRRKDRIRLAEEPVVGEEFDRCRSCEERRRPACGQRQPANAQARKAITTHMTALAAIKSPSTVKIRHIGAFKPGAEAPGIPSSRSACGKLKAN